MAENSPKMEQPPEPINLADFDTTKPAVAVRLQERTAGGGYVVPDVRIIRAIRTANGMAKVEQRNALFALLTARCQPMFRRAASGLRHRRELYEDAIADMTTQLWKEVLDEKETFMERNFAYYLKCLGIDHFNRALRSEGLKNKVNEQGQIIGRPERVPAALIDHIDHQQRSADSEEDTTADIADPTDAISGVDSNDAVKHILYFLPDQLDRKIVTLREIYHMKWDEIAQICHMSERTMRTRHANALKQLRIALENQDENE